MLRCGRDIQPVFSRVDVAGFLDKKISPIGEFCSIGNLGLLDHWGSLRL